MLELPFRLVQSSQPTEISSEAPVIFYLNTSLPNTNGLHICPHGLLSETEIRHISPQVKWLYPDLPAIFPNNSETEFDVFSSVFYMVSRYEEYLPFQVDSFGRFPESESLSGREGFTHFPVVHYWARHLFNCLQQKFPGIKSPDRKASALFTYDVDVAYAYKGRSLLTHILSFGKDILKGRPGSLALKLKFAFGKRGDPSDTYELLISNKLKVLVFFLLSAKKSRFDRNVHPQKKVIQDLIRYLRKHGLSIGIHPSYNSLEKPDLIESEKKTLENILHENVTMSRQHYLRFRFPSTFRHLHATGIAHDFSLQYPEKPGFRAGICLPFPFFDLEKNQQTNLMIHPGCIMETTFRDDLHIPANKSLDVYLQIWKSVQSVGGQFISIWHNDTLWAHLPDEHPLAFRQVHQRLAAIIQNDMALNL